MSVPSAKEILKKIAIDSDWFSVRKINEKTSHRMFRDAKPDTQSHFDSSGFMIEVMNDGYIGYAATNDFSSEAIQECANKAKGQSLQLKNFGLSQFSINERPPSTGKYQSPKKKEFSSLSPKDLSDFQTKCCEKLKVSDQILSTSSALIQTDLLTEYASSNGADIEQELNLLSTDLIAIASDGNESHRRSDFGWNGKSYQGGAELLDFDTYFERCKIVGEEAVELLSAENCPSDTRTLVLYPDQLMLQIHESIGHPLEVDRILGDERNYAGSSFVNLEDFGNLQYGSKLMNVTFDPGVEGQYASYGFDDGGFKGERKYLIKDGKLLTGLGGLESSKRSGLEPVSNFRAQTWNRPPVDRMANINVEPGNESEDEIIGKVEKGILMYSNLSWSIDDYRRKFQFGCEYAKLIENGKITKTIKNPNYRGETLQFWNSLVGVGNKDSWKVFGSPYCGKAEPNQIIRVGHASPMCAFKDIEVFGGSQ